MDRAPGRGPRPPATGVSVGQDGGCAWSSWTTTARTEGLLARPTAVPPTVACHRMRESGLAGSWGERAEPGASGREKTAIVVMLSTGANAGGSEAESGAVARRCLESTRTVAARRPLARALWVVSGRLITREMESTGPARGSSAARGE
jgi:hypothetical protein